MEPQEPRLRRQRLRPLHAPGPGEEQTIAACARGRGSHRQTAPKRGVGPPSRSPRSSNGRPSIWSNIHPRQEERHEVLSGTLWGRVGGQEQVFTEGQRVIGLAGVPHAWRNPSEDEELHIVSELRPPLRFETLCETAFGLARDGKTTKQGMPKSRCSPQCWSTKPGECSTSPGRPYRCRERSSRCSPCWLPSAGSSGTRLAARITAAWKNPERKRGRAPVGDHRAEDQWRGDGDRPGRLLRVLLASKAQALEQEIELRRQFPSTALTQVIHRLLGRDQVLSEVCYLQATPK